MDSSDKLTELCYVMLLPTNKLFKDNQFTVFFLPHMYNQGGQKLQRRNNQGGIKINKQEKKST